MSTTDDAMDDPTELPLPLLSTTRLWVTGRWGQGGIVRLQDGGRQATVLLPPALFHVLAILI
jgi:hypothetical protein